VESSEVESLTIEYVDRLADTTDRLKLRDAIQALVVDLSQFDKHELEALRVLMHATPNMPVLVVGDDDDLTRHAVLLAQGAQDLLLKSNLDGGALRRAVRNAMARKAREVAVFNDNERARVTLASIGDAVLSTDGSWLVSFINPIAEELLGWTCL
jgi:DNA-binding NarL/FixJ family response regulator